MILYSRLHKGRITEVQGLNWKAGSVSFYVDAKQFVSSAVANSLSALSCRSFLIYFDRRSRFGRVKPVQSLKFGGALLMIDK